MGPEGVSWLPEPLAPPQHWEPCMVAPWWCPSAGEAWAWGADLEKGNCDTVSSQAIVLIVRKMAFYLQEKVTECALACYDCVMIVCPERTVELEKPDGADEQVG